MTTSNFIKSQEFVLIWMKSEWARTVQICKEMYETRTFCPVPIHFFLNFRLLYDLYLIQILLYQLQTLPLYELWCEHSKYRLICYLAKRKGNSPQASRYEIGQNRAIAKFREICSHVILGREVNFTTFRQIWMTVNTEKFLQKMPSFLTFFHTLTSIFDNISTTFKPTEKDYQQVCCEELRFKQQFTMPKMDVWPVNFTWRFAQYYCRYFGWEFCL